MAPSLVQSVSATGTTSPLSVTLSATTAGNCLIVCTAGNASGNDPSVTAITLGGAAGNFAQVVTAGNPASDFAVTSIWADPNCAGGQTAVSVTFTSSGTASVCATVMEWSGLATSSVTDKTASQVNSSGTTSWSSTATATTTQASEVAIGCVGGYNGTAIGTITGPGAGWTNLTQETSASTHLGLLAGYQVLSSTTTATYSGTFAASSDYAAAVATFKAAPGVSVALTTPNIALAAPALTPSAGATVALTAPGLALAAPPLTVHAGPVPAASWTGSYAVATGFPFPYPSARPVQVSVTNTPGDWLFALVTWRQPAAGGATSVCVADDAHNWWEPVGAGGAAALDGIEDTAGSAILDTTGSPLLDTTAGTGVTSADSPAAGVVRTAVWAAPAARVTPGGTTIVQVAATGPYLSMAVLIVDMAGMRPWYQVAAITSGYANAATSLALTAGAPAAQALEFAVFGSDNNSDVITGPAGWTALTTVTASNGVDHTADITLTPAYQVTGGSTTASVSSSGTLDLAGVIAGVMIAAPAPSQPNPAWPVMITEAAVGAGVQVPPAQLTWTDISSRSLALSIKQGKQYSLGSLSAGQGSITLDSPDGATIPPGSGVFAGIDSGMPLRRRVIIPQLASPHYVAFSGFYRRSPWAMDPALYRGKTTAEITDVWGYASGPLNSMAIEEALIDSPRDLWPATDPAGSTGASNLAPGNALPLTQVTSKYGAGGAVAAWGQNSGGLVGASSAQVTASGTGGGGTGMWSQALDGNSLAYNGYGYALAATDPGYPAVSGGVTAETWASCTLTPTLTAIGGNGLCLVSTSGATFNTAQSKFPDGMPVTLGILGGSSLPTPFTAGTYYVTGSDGQGNYNLSATQGGTAITTTSSGVGTLVPFLLWDPAIMSLRDGKGTVTGLSIRNTDGALLLLQRNGTSVTAAAVDTGHDYRNGIWHFSLAITQTTWRLLVNAGATLTATGTFSPALPSSFREASFAGVQDSTSQGYALPGDIGFAAVYPGFSTQQRVVNRWWSQIRGMAGEAACDRVERILEYAGLAGRRWLGQQGVTYEGDLCASGQDIGGQGAASACGNIAQSTLPAQLYVAPTGDIMFRSKLYTWNEPVKWVLGGNAGAGEIPFLVSMATDYDPTRVSAPVQVTSLDTQGITVASGTTSSTTMAAVTAAAARQYGGQPYQSTSYLLFDYSSRYTDGGSSVDLANWVANIYRRPQNRVQAVSVEASANSANANSQQAWQFWAGCSVGDMVQVNVRPPTASTSPLISLIARVTQTDRSSQFSQDGTSARLTATLDFAPEYNALTCDDAVRGKLDGSNCLGW